MKHKFLLIALVLLLSLSLTQAQENKVCVHFYWGEGCGACKAVKPDIQALAEKYPEMELHEIEIYNNRQNMLQLLDFYEKFGVPLEDRGIPTVIVNDAIYIGVFAIRKNLEAKILEYQETGLECPSIVTSGEIISPEEGEEISGLESEQVSLLVLTSAALVDSINPCAIAVLIILLMALLASGTKKRALKAGLAFSLSIYIAYFLFGLGIFSLLKAFIDWFTEVRTYFYIIIGLLAIIIGLANLKDYFCYGAGGFVCEIPRSWRPKAKSLLNKVTSPLGAFFTGFVICLFELPCTGGPYLFILGLLAEKTTFWTAVPLLLYYNVFFILPLLVITGLVYKGMETTEIDAWKERNIRRIHLVTGLVMLLLGLAVIFGFF